MACHKAGEETMHLESQIFIQGGQTCPHQIGSGSYPNILDGTCMDPQEYPISSAATVQSISMEWESRFFFFAWISWKKIALPKKWGGWGLKGLPLFAQALTAKMGWTLLTC